MTALPPWLVNVLPILAAVIVILIVVLIVIAIRQLGGAAPAARPASAPAEPKLTIAAQMRRGADWLAALYGGRNPIDAVPLLLAVGAGSAALQRMMPKLALGDLARAQLDLFRGDCRLSVCPDGAVVSFEDGLLASERWEARWGDLLRALSKQREDRPFDGLVIVLTAKDLAGPARLSDDDLTVRGERLYQLLWTAQRTGGWRVPIYLLLNECEVLNGFAATAAELPERMRREPFGWTVPYALDTAYARGWIREGIEALTALLSTLQLQLLTGLRDPGGAESVLLFPNALALLAEPLAVLLTPMLQPSAYHDAFMFRGFYLTGRAAPAADAAASDGADLFAAQLFAQRIFPEQFLAQPVRGATTRRQRQIRIAQGVLGVLVVLALVGVAHVRRYRDAVKTVLPLVREIAALGERAQSTGPETGPAVTSTGPSRAQAEQTWADTKALVRAMAAVSLNRLETAWAPLSYFTDVSAEVEQSIRKAYGVEVLRTVHTRLTDGIPALLGVEPPADGASSDAPSTKLGVTACAARGATSADVAQLAQIMQRLSEYSQQLRRYQELPEHPQIENLKALLEFTLAVSLPPGFSTNYYLYEHALRGAEAPLLEMEPIRATVGALLRAQFARALAGAYPGSTLGRAVDEVMADAGVYRAGASSLPAIERLQRLKAALHTVAVQAPLPEYAWMRDGVSSSAITEELSQLEVLSRNGGSADLAPVDSHLPPEFSRAAAACATRTRGQLRAASVFGGVLVLTDEQTSFGLSSQLRAVDQTLELFLAQPLVTAAVAPASPWPGEVDGPLYWDPQDLQALQAAGESYLLFVAQDLPATLPTAFREQLQAAAGQRIDLLTRNAIARAQQSALTSRTVNQPGSTAALSAAMARFADAVPILTNLRTLLRGAGRTNSAERLDQLLSGQATQLLGQVDAILLATDPYQLVDGNLAFWSGTPPLAAPAFGAATLPDLVGTLPARRDYVEALARDHAAPMVTYLQQSDVLLSDRDRALLTRWRGIMTTLDRYHRSDPANSLSRLEQFIAVDLNRVNLANCTQVTAGASGGTDWFAVRLGNLSRAVRKRCGEVTHHDSVAQYHDLAESFNRDLAGRFPFGGVTAPDADPADVKRFFNRFGGTLAALRQRLAGLGPYARAGTPRLIDRLLAVQVALAPMLADPAPDAPLTYAVAVDFRTNIGGDPGANQIVETIAQFGQRQVSSFATSDNLAWSDGQSTRMILRWAKDAPNVPAGGVAQSPQVRGLTATYEYRGAWALLRMIAAQRPDAAVMAQLADRRPATLGFALHLKRNPAAADGGATGQCGRWRFWCSTPATASSGPGNLTNARVFMRFGLTATVRVPGQPDQHHAVTLPIFPTAAPQVGAAPQATARSREGAGPVPQ